MNSRLVRRFLGLACTLVAATPWAIARADTQTGAASGSQPSRETSPATAMPEMPKAEERWFIVRLGGQKCGYMFIGVKPEGKEVHTRSLMSMEVRRDEHTVKITADQQFTESQDGRPLGFRSVMTLAEKPMTTEGTIENGRLKLIQDQYGSKRESTYDFDPEAKFAWGLQLEQRKHGLAPGTTFTVKSYDPGIAIDRPFELTLKVEGKESVAMPSGEKRELIKVTSKMELQGMSVSTLSWVDDEAEPQVMDFNMGGFTVHVVAATKEQALEGNAAPELFINTFVKVDKRISNDAKLVKYRLRLPDDKTELKMPNLPDTPAQSVQRINDREAILTVRRLDWEAIRRAGDKAGEDPAMATYLQASPVVDINDRRIKTHARRAVKGCSTPAEKADALRRYVTDFIENKSLDVGFATASEVVRTRKGDCSEHAVLLAALARASGLPARGVSGIVQVPAGMLPSSSGSMFGYHMWTQVNIDGQWVDVDAALRQTDCSPTHIALAIMPLNDEGLTGSVISMLPLLGRLQMEIISVEPPAVGEKP